MSARPRATALEAEGPTESGTARLSRQALNTRRTEMRTVAHRRLESRRTGGTSGNETSRPRLCNSHARNVIWNFFRQEFDELSYFDVVQVFDVFEPLSSTVAQCAADGLTSNETVLVVCVDTMTHHV